MRTHRSRALAAALTLSLVTAGAADAQTLYGITGSGDVWFTEWSHDGGGACNYPNLDIVTQGVNVPFACPNVDPFPLPPNSLLGDVAVDKRNDLVYVTDGAVIACHLPDGTPVAGANIPLGYALGGFITGMGFNSGAGTLWITDGVDIAEIIPPGCGTLGPVVTPAFPAPTGVPITDITWDPYTGTLYACDIDGFIVNINVGGGVGPTGIWMVAPGGCLGAFGGFLTGIAMDTGSNNPFIPDPALYVTDGERVAYVDPFANPAPGQFYTPVDCQPVPFGSAPISGLAFSSHPIDYGKGADSAGLVPPHIDAIGQALSPGGPLTITLDTAVPGSNAYLTFEICAACPAVPIAGGLPYYLGACLPSFSFIGPLVVPVGGSLALPTGAVPPGVEGFGLYMQWLVDKPGPGWQVTEGLHTTFSLP